MFGDGGIGGAVGGDNSRVYPILGFRLLSRLIYEEIKHFLVMIYRLKKSVKKKLGFAS